MNLEIILTGLMTNRPIPCKLRVFKSRENDEVGKTRVEKSSRSARLLGILGNLLEILR